MSPPTASPAPTLQPTFLCDPSRWPDPPAPAGDAAAELKLLPPPWCWVIWRSTCKSTLSPLPCPAVCLTPQRPVLLRLSVPKRTKKPQNRPASPGRAVYLSPCPPLRCSACSFLLSPAAGCQCVPPVSMYFSARRLLHAWRTNHSTSQADSDETCQGDPASIGGNESVQPWGHRVSGHWCSSCACAWRCCLMSVSGPARACRMV